MAEGIRDLLVYGRKYTHVFPTLYKPMYTKNMLITMNEFVIINIFFVRSGPQLPILSQCLKSYLSYSPQRVANRKQSHVFSILTANITETRGHLTQMGH